MAKASLAHAAHEPATEERPPAYVLRGHGLFELYRDDLEYIGSGTWLIPSGSKGSKDYKVRVGLRRESQCECVGHENHGHCSHVVCASIAHKRSAVCDSCSSRRWWSEITEVFEDDALLSWYPGDRLCKSCIRAGAWT